MAQHTHQLLIHLPEELRSEFKETCDKRRESMSEVIRGYIKQYIESER